MLEDLRKRLDYLSSIVNGNLIDMFDDSWKGCLLQLCMSVFKLADRIN